MTSDQPKIFVVEDEAIIAAEIKSTLGMLGYQVVGHAMNGDKALDMLANTKVDLALLDINIKGSLSGIDLAEVIRVKYNFPYIFLTSFSDKATLTRVMDTMPSGYIVKPFSDDDLRVNIEMALHKHSVVVQQRTFTKEYAEEMLKVDLSTRDFEVLSAFKEGMTYKEIASKLFISINTVKTYQKRLFKVLGVSSKYELLRRLN